MVKILGGEIVRDNDPRVLALQAAHEAASRQHAEQQAANDYYRYYGTNNPYNTNNIHPNHYMPYPPHYPNYHQSYYYPHPSYPYSPSPYSQPHVPSTTANSYFNHNFSTSSSTSSSSSSLPHTDLSSSSIASPSASSSSSSSSSSPSASSHSSHPSPIHPSLYPSQRIRQSNPYAYNLFGLPDVKVLDINVKPHLYLLAFLCVFLIGPRALVAVVFAFFTYRWHLNNVAKEEARKRPYPAHFKKPFAYSSPQQHFRRSGIATLHDLHQSDQRSLGQM